MFVLKQLKNGKISHLQINPFSKNYELLITALTPLNKYDKPIIKTIGKFDL
jgi:hypothetical protein